MPIDTLQSYDAWIAFLDVYGFKAMIATKDQTLISQNLAKAHQTLRNEIKEIPGEELLYSFSDSVFIVLRVAKPDDKGFALHKCVERCQQIMNIFVDKELPLRGGIAFGSVCVGDQFIVGDALVRAVSYEGLVDAPLVLLPAFEIGKELISQVTEITVKGGLIKAKLIFPDPLDNYWRFVTEAAQRYLSIGPPNVALAWVNARNYIETYASPALRTPGDTRKDNL